MGIYQPKMRIFYPNFPFQSMNRAKFIKDWLIKGFCTFVPSVENLWEFVGSFEVEESRHGEDEEQAEEKGAQDQGGSHLWAP